MSQTLLVSIKIDASKSSAQYGYTACCDEIRGEVLSVLDNFLGMLPYESFVTSEWVDV